MGGESTKVCDEATTEVFVESAWFDPICTAQTGRMLGISSDAQYRFARGVDTGFVVPGLEMATRLILEICGGEPCEVRVAGHAPAPPAAVEFDHSLRGKALRPQRRRGADRPDPHRPRLRGARRDGHPPPSWRRDVDGKADLVEEVARIEGFGALPSTPLPRCRAPPAGC